MESEAQKKREQELEKRLRTPKATLSREKYTELDTQETQWLIHEFLSGKFYLYEATNCPQSSHEHDRTELEEIYHREQALTELKDIIKDWIVEVAKGTGGMDENLARDEEARIFTFGSHRLGVNSRGGDIDTLVLCPSYVDRATHFFEDLFEVLAQHPHVEELVKVNDAKVLVPVIKMKFHGIDIDLAFAKLDVPKLDKNLKNLNDNDLLATLDEKMTYSINGPRNVDMIIQSVDPKEDPGRISNFRTTLKLLKLWAKNKGIYSNAMGYVTGISLAILVAKVCQLFPNLKPNKLVQKFFQYYSIWNWDEFPVKIEEVRTYENLEKFNDMQWYDPASEIGMEKISQRKKDDFTSPMMVITPAFPVMNATRKVTRTNLEIMKEQLLQGKEIVARKPIDWHKLFGKIDFFDQYFNFIEVTVLANEEKEFYRWSGLIESQMIVLTKALETRIELQGHPRSLRLHPYPVSFVKSDPDFAFSESYYYGLKFLKPPGNKASEDYVELTDAVFEFLSRQMTRKQEGQYQTGNIRIVQMTRPEVPQTTLDQAMGIQPAPEIKSTLGKRPLEGIEGSEFEPTVVKKVVLHTREDAEAKSANSTTGSPQEGHDHHQYGMHGNGIVHKSITEPPPVTAVNKENMEEIPKKPHVIPQPGNIKFGMGKPQVNPPPGLIGKTNFSSIDTSSLLNQSSELDDFL